MTKPTRPNRLAELTAPSSGQIRLLVRVAIVFTGLAPASASLAIACPLCTEGELKHSSRAEVLPAPDGVEGERVSLNIEIVENNRAVVRASATTSTSLIHAITTALREAGIKQLSLRCSRQDARSPKVKKGIELEITDREAEISISGRVPYKVIELVIEHLSRERMIRKVKFGPPITMEVNTPRDTQER